MARQSLVPKKKRGPPPTGKGTQVQVRLQPDLLGALDSFVSDQAPTGTRPEGIRMLLRDYLIGLGYLKS